MNVKRFETRRIAVDGGWVYQAKGVHRDSGEGRGRLAWYRPRGCVPQRRPGAPRRAPVGQRARNGGIRRAELERLAEYAEDRDGLHDRPDAPTLRTLGLTPANLDGIGRVLDLDDWLNLSLIAIVRVPVFKFRAREREYMPF